jgi:adenylate kinase
MASLEHAFAALDLKGRIVVVLGPPCSGKGTQCKRLAQKFGLVHFSTGDGLRELAAKGTDLGLQVKDFEDRNSLVPDDLVIRVIRERLAQDDVQQKGCLVDGFPRTGPQAESLLQTKVDIVILLEASNEAMLLRAPDRRVDPETGQTYHLKFVPPPSDVENRLIRRKHDDDSTAFKRRLESYRTYIRQVLPFFSGKVKTLDAGLEPDVVFRNFVKVLAEMEEKNDDLWPEEQAKAMDSDMPRLVLHPCTKVSDEGGLVNVCVTIEVPSISRPPTLVVCVIDVSGSMDSQITYEQDGKEVSSDLTTLDIVKHAAKAVIHMLGDEDEFALVKFEQQASTVFAPTKMTEEGRKAALAALEGLSADGGTDIWAGCEQALETIRNSPSGGALSHAQSTILLLTDGVPSESHCPLWHRKQLQLYKDKYPTMAFQLNTFGFGYNLLSDVLMELSEEGNGTFAFCPDALIVGTTFVNTVANSLSLHSQDAVLSIMPPGTPLWQAGEVTPEAVPPATPEVGGSGGGNRKGTKGKKGKGHEPASQPFCSLLQKKKGGACLGGYPQHSESWGFAVHLGPLQSGASRQIVVQVEIPPLGDRKNGVYMEAALTFPQGCSSRTSMTKVVSAEVSACEPSRDAKYGALLADFVDTGVAAITTALDNKDKAAGELLQQLSKRVSEAVKQSKIGSDVDDRMSALEADVKGRMSKSVQGLDRFNRWGKHYLRALIRAHQLQVCTNFMDPGLQVYGGDLFKSLRENGDEVFVSLPPPSHAGYHPMPLGLDSAMTCISSAACDLCSDCVRFE